MTPVATARLRLSARPRMGILTTTSQSCASAALSPACSGPIRIRPAGRTRRAIVDVSRKQRADDRARPGPAPRDEGGGRRPVERDGEDRAHRRPDRLHRIGVAGLADQDHPAGAGSVDRADDRAQVAGVANGLKGYPGRRGRRVEVRELGGAWPNTATTACGLSRRETFSRIAWLTSMRSPPALRFVCDGEEGGQGGRLGCVKQHPGCPPELDGLNDEFQPLGEELAARLPRLAHMQRARGLDDRIVQRRDGPRAHPALQRAKKERPTPRSPLSSISASSPQSMRPARPAIASLSSPASATPEMRSA